MKRRLRKKLCLAEFTEWGVDLAVKRTGSDGFDEFFDDFIDLIEAQDCYCGGGGGRGWGGYLPSIGGCNYSPINYDD